MNRLEFLSTILPSTGKYCIVGIVKGKVQQIFVDSIDEINVWADQQVEKGIDTYFSLASYKEPSGRNAKNSDKFRSLWVDLDIGKNTAFADQAVGLAALRKFIDTVKLPKPTVVSSGYGLHVYWAFEEEVDYNIWKPLATALVQHISAEGFEVKDKGLTTDAARILRIPNTKNFKNDSQIDVKVLFTSPSTPVEQLKNILKVGALSPVSMLELSGSASNSLNETTRALLGNTVYKFSRIMQKTAGGNGCAQMLNVYTNQDEISEPLWRAGLSIAQFCEDRETAIHKISCRHPEYDPVETETKANNIKGPHLCSTFKTLDSLTCDGCKYAGTISSPLLLGRDILEALPTDNIITAVSPDLGVVDIEIPEYPYPYFRGPKGGVYIKKPLDDLEEGELDKNLVYENDLYVVGRRTDPDAGEVIHMRLIRPHDGVSDFTAPLATVTASDKCRDMLSQRGVAASAKQMQGLMSYLIAWTKHLQNTSRAELVRTQFGWHDDNTAFVIGTRELTKNNLPVYSPPSTATETVVSVYSKAGTLDAWKGVVNNYALPGNEVRAFALFLSLGAPMFKLFSLGGAIVHLTNASSGVGKSTIQKVANSVWGHPDEAMLMRDDKVLSKYHRMGVVQNMILCIDELTNLPPKEVSDLAFGVTNGRGRNRMEASSNSERVNKTTWSLPCLTSGNNSLHEVLQSEKADPEGELMRVLEIEVVRSDDMSKQETDQIFSRDLLDNYGHTGEIIMQYVLDNYEECVKSLYATQIEFDKAVRFKQRERYYSALCATAMWGGKIANALGLINIPVKPVFDDMVKRFRKPDEGDMSTVEVSCTYLGTFMSEYIQNQLIINQAASTIEGVLSAPIESPRGPLAIRREPDVKRAYIIASILKAWCAKKQVSYKNMLKDLATVGILIDVSKIRMSAGTPQDSPAVMALVLDSTKIS